MQKLTLAPLLLSLSLLTSCGAKDSRQYLEKTVYKCHEEYLVQYDDAFNARLIDELDNVSDSSTVSTIVTALSDYSVLRDKIKACAQVTKSL